uniref:Uncharacterized protein n=1 Tax=Anguilla anguilla TaxID=7936 RepID=A0A0E9QAZ9_ANGAN
MPAVQCRHNVQFLVRSSFTQASWICEITNFFLKTSPTCYSTPKPVGRLSP